MARFCNFNPKVAEEAIQALNVPGSINLFEAIGASNIDWAVYSNTVQSIFNSRGNSDTKKVEEVFKLYYDYIINPNRKEALNAKIKSIEPTWDTLEFRISAASQFASWWNGGKNDLLEEFFNPILSHFKSISNNVEGLDTYISRMQVDTNIDELGVPLAMEELLETYGNTTNFRAIRDLLRQELVRYTKRGEIKLIRGRIYRQYVPKKEAISKLFKFISQQFVFISEDLEEDPTNAGLQQQFSIFEKLADKNNSKMRYRILQDIYPEITKKELESIEGNTFTEVDDLSFTERILEESSEEDTTIDDEVLEEEKRMNMSDSINDSDSFNMFHGVSKTIKDYLTNIPDPRNRLRVLSPKYVYVKTLQLFDQLEPWRESFINLSDFSKSDLRKRAEKEGTDITIVEEIENLYAAATETTRSYLEITDRVIGEDISDLEMALDLGATQEQIDFWNENSTSDKPTHFKFLDPNTFIIGSVGQDLTAEYNADNFQPLYRQFRESTDAFIERIERSISLDGLIPELALVDLAFAFRQMEARNTWSELVNNMTSQKEKNIKIGEFTQDFGDTIKFLSAKEDGAKRASKVTLKSAINDYFTNEDRNSTKKKIESVRKLIKVTSKSNAQQKVAEINKFLGIIGQNAPSKKESERIPESLVTEVHKALYFFFKKDGHVTNIEQDIPITSETDEDTGEKEIILTEISDILDIQGTSLINLLSNYISFNSTFERPTSSRDAEGKRKYNWSPSSQGMELIIKLGRRSLDWITKNRGAKYLAHDRYKNNIFITKLNKVYNIVDYGGTRIISQSGTSRSIPYSKEKFKDFVHRGFTFGFLGNIASSPGKTARYTQWIPTISNRPNPTGVEVKVLTPEQIDVGLNAYLEEFVNNEKVDSIEVHKVDQTIDFEIASKAAKTISLGDINNLTRKNLDKHREALIEAMKQELTNIAKEVTERMIREEVGLPKNIADNNVGKFVDQTKYPGYSLEESFEKVHKNKQKDDLGVSQFILKEEQLLPLMDAFVSNNYINSYFLDQLVMGNSNFFKDSKDKVKRRSGAFAPGLVGYISPWAMKETFKVAIMSDQLIKTKRETPVIDKQGKPVLDEDGNPKVIVEEVNSIEDFLKRMGVPEGEEMDTLLLSFGEDYEPTDAQGFMLPSRQQEIAAGFGRAYGLGNVLKPAHYEIDSNGIPRMLKYSAIVLTDELVGKYPGLLRIRQAMERHKDAEGNSSPIQEMVFRSGNKVGIPRVKGDIDKVLENKNVPSDGDYMIPPEATFELSNSRYRLQLNPYHAGEGSIAKPTQLSYFLNILGTNEESAKKVYDAMGKLITIGSNEFKDSVTDSSGRTSNRGIIKKLLTNFKGANGERAAQILKSLSTSNKTGRTGSSLAFNFPAIQTTSVIQLSSSLSKVSVDTRFKGMKLVLQSQVGIKVDTFDGRGPRKLSYKLDKNGGMYAEVLIPSGLLDEHSENELRFALENKQPLPDTFLYHDLLGFRIPSSEIHSAVPLKVVGFYDDSKNTNVVIAPKELVPLHGSDFDVDSLFAIRRERIPKMSEEVNNVIGFLLGEEGYVGMEKVGDSWQMTDIQEFEFLIEKMKVEAEAEGNPKVVKYVKNLEKLFYKNIIVDEFLKVTISENNRVRMVSPISMEKIKKDVKRIDKLLPENERLSGNRDLSNFMDNYRLFESSMGGVTGTGIYANGIKTLAYMIRANSEHENNLPTLNNFKPFTLNDNELKALVDDKELWEDLDALLNASIDNVKEQLLPGLNMTGETIASYIAIRSLGVDLQTANNLMVQPVMKRVVEVGGKEAFSKVKRELESSEVITSSNLADGDLTKFDLNNKELTNSIKNYKPLGKISNPEDAVFQLKVITFMEQMQKIGSDLTDLSSFLGIIKSMPIVKPKIDHVLGLKNKIFNEKGETKGGFSFKMDTFFDVNPHINSALNTVEQLNSLIEEKFFLHNKGVYDIIKNSEFLKRISLEFDSSKDKELKRQEFLKYMMTSLEDFENVPDFRYKGKVLNKQESFSQHFAREIKAVKKHLALKNQRNDFLDKIAIDSIPRRPNLFEIKFEGGTSLDPEDIIDIIDAFNRLRFEVSFENGKYTVTENEGTPAVKTGFQRGFLKYAILNYGLNFGASNYSTVLPTDLYQDFFRKYENRMKHFLREENRHKLESLKDDFEIQLALNFGDKVQFSKKTHESKEEEKNSSIKINGNHIIYDRAYTRSSDKVLPKIIRLGNKRSSRLYVRVNEADEATSIYQMAGFKRDSPYYIPNKSLFDRSGGEYKIDEKFREDIFAIHVTNDKFKSKNFTLLNKALSKIWEENLSRGITGKPIMIVNTNDPLRNNVRYVVAKRKLGDHKFEVVDVPPPEPRLELPQGLRKISSETSVGQSIIVTHKDASANIQRALPLGKKMNLHDILDITSNSADKEVTGRIIDKLKQVTSNITVKAIDREDVSWRGRYHLNAETGEETIQVNYAKDSDLSRVLMHEAVHAATAVTLRADEATLSNSQKVARRRLGRLFTIAKNRAEELDQNFYGITNIDEFVAEAFSNPDFQNFLAGFTVVESKPKTFWNELVELVAKILLLGENNLLVDVLDTSMSLFTQSKFGNTSDVELFSDTAVEEEVDITLETILNRSKELTVPVGPNGKQATFYNDSSQPGKQFNRVTDNKNGLAKLFLRTPRTEDLATYIANKKWHNIDKNTPLVNDLSEQPLNYEDFIVEQEAAFDQGKAKGKIIHKWLEFILTQDRKILDEIQQFSVEAGIGLDAYEWIAGSAKDIMYNADINIFQDNVPQEYRDKVMPEVSVASDSLGFAGTMDLLVKHSDGLYSIVDWKTGNNFDKERLTKLLRYGRQVTEITDSPRDMAKLQVMLYAIILKSQHPDIKFKHLSVINIPNKIVAKNPDRSRQVEVNSYLPMIEKLLKDEVALKEMGLPANMFSKLQEEFERNNGIPGQLFRASEYTNNPTKGLDEKGNGNGLTGDQSIESKLAELSSISNASLDGKVSKEDRDRATQIAKEISIAKGDVSSQFILDGSKDVKLMTQWLGNISDVPLLNVFNRLREASMQKVRESFNRKKDILNGLFRPIRDKELQGKHFAQRIGLNNFNYRKIFGKYLTTFMHNGREVERLLHNQETDPEKVNAYNALTEQERKFLDYFNKTVEEYFGPKGLMDTVVTTKELYGEKKNLTHLDLYNAGKSADRKFKYYKGFLPKIMITPEEAREQFGAFKDPKKFGEHVVRKYATQFVENNFDGYNSNETLAIKVLGSPEIETQKLYSVQLDRVFDLMVRNMEYKDHMEDIYAYGKGLVWMFEDQEAVDSVGNSKKLYEKTAKFLDDKLEFVIRGRRKREKFIDEPIRFTRNKVTENLGIAEREVDIDQLLRQGGKFTNNLVMALKPVSATGNTIHASLINWKEAAVGDLTVKLFGDETNVVDYTTASMARAVGQWNKMIPDEINGNIRKNKMFLLARKFGYLPENYDYATDGKHMLSERNRMFDPANLFIAHALGENMVSYTTMAAQLMYAKHPKTGKPLWDHYDVKEVIDDAGNPTGEFDVFWEGESRGLLKKGAGDTVSYEEINGLTADEILKLKRVHARLQGDYRKDEATNVEAYVLGRLMIALKRYFHRLVFNGWVGRKEDFSLGSFKKLVETRKDPETGEELDVYEWQARVVEGRWRTLAKMLYSILGGSAKTHWNNLSAEEKKNLLDAGATLTMLALGYAAYILAFGDVDDDDTLKKFWKMYLIDNVSQQYNPVDLLRTAKEYPKPVMAKKMYDTATSLGSVMWATGAYMGYSVGLDIDESEFLTRRGDWRGWNTFKKSIPIGAPIWDLLDRIENTEALSFWMNENAHKLR